MNEQWKDVAGYEGLYQVSNYGRVRSLDRYVANKNGIALKKGKIITSADVSKKKYQKVNLWKDNSGKCYLVHRLVAEAFLPNPEHFQEVNHKDENPLNNSADNLEWCDRTYNAHYGTRGERAAAKVRGVPIGEQPILQYTIDGVLIARHESAMKAAMAVSGDNSSICKCANGKNKTSYGFVWKWEQER